MATSPASVEGLHEMVSGYVLHEDFVQTAQILGVEHHGWSCKGRAL